MTPFRWKNCAADISTSRHDLTIQSYLDDVILPALSTLQRQIEALGESDDPGDAFAQSDLKDVLQETKLAFGLSIQSIWERQLRAYLRGCALELHPKDDLAAKVAKADWEGLAKLFQRLRGIELSAFPSFPDLDLLQHLGNAARHGDGRSAVELYRRAPDFWSSVKPLPQDLIPEREGPPTVAEMSVPVERLQAFVAAIAAFWRDADFIYCESISRKHPSLERRLAQERLTRSWRPQRD
jgi:hypothetical protein